MVNRRVRFRRLLGVSLVLAAFVASALAGPASAAQPTYTFFLDVTSTGSYVEAWAPSSASSSYSIEVLRQGAVIASDSGGSNDQSVVYPGALLAGDIIRFSTGDASSSVVFDGMPTIDSGACVGSRTVAGAVSPGATSLYAGSAIGSGSAGANPGVVSRSGGSYTATFARPLAPGATVFAGDNQTFNNGDTSLWVTREVPVASCSSGEPPGGGQSGTPPGGSQTPSNPPSGNQTIGAQILSALKAALGRQGRVLSTADPITIARSGFVDIPFVFVAPGSVTFTWQVTLLRGKAVSAARRKAKKTVVTIASGTARSSAAGKGKARLKLTAAGRRLLKTAKAVQVTMTARFVPASGGPAQQTKTRFTLHRKAKHAKGKSKKH